MWLCIRAEVRERKNTPGKILMCAVLNKETLMKKKIMKECNCEPEAKQEENI